MINRLFTSFALFSFCLFPVSQALAVGQTASFSSPASVMLAVDRDDEYVTGISMEISEYNLQSVETQDAAYDRIDHGLEPATTREGWPDLPMISRAILVPPTSGVHLEINNIESRIETGFNPFIVPPLDGSADTGVPGEPAAEYLSYDGFWPPEPVVMSEPAILRGYRMVQVTIFPIQHNRATGETRFNDRVDFELVYGGQGRNPVENPDRPRPSRYVNRALQRLVVNPPEPGRDDLMSGSYLYIVPEVNGVDEALEPLLEWRNRQGHKVVVEHVQNNASQNTVMNLIRAAYDDWDVPVEFVALVGDAGGSISLAAYTANGDYGYSRVDGNDPLPDVAVGRISVGSLNDLRRVVNKLVTYEADPWLDEPEWFLKGAVVAGYPGNGLGTVLVAKYVRKELLDLGFDDVTHWYHTENGDLRGGQQEQYITAQFDRGISIFHYRAYQSMNGLSHGCIANLPNRDGPWPAFLAISCNTGDFNGRDGNTEAFLRSEGGAVGAIGTATAGTSVQYNNIMSGGVWKAIYKDGLYAMGWGLNGGKYGLWRAYDGHDGAYMNYMEWNNLMGDPGTHVWTGQARLIEVTHEETIARGENRFRVSVEYEDEEGSVPEALVCLYIPEEMHIIQYTDAEGMVEFILPTGDIEADEMMVTVTKHNHAPYLADVEIEEVDYFIGVEDWSIDDDGDPNPGESIELTLVLTNFGTEVPDGPIIITSKELSEWAEVTSDAVEVEEAPESGESVEITVDVDIHESAPDGHIALIAVEVSNGENDWNSLAALDIEAPKILVKSIELAEQNFSPGMMSELDIELVNSGRATIDEFTATLWSETNLVSVSRAVADYDGLAPRMSDMQANGRFEISAHPFTIPGMDVELRLSVESEQGFRDTTSFKVPVGRCERTSPFGPDGYGYVCFDSGDEGWEMKPVFDWIEIDPDINDNDFDGENTGLRDGGDNQDQSVVVDLPFEFQYYGEIFTELTICTNGWAAFGNQRELLAFRNRHIAQALGPNAQLCVWWDNLITNQGKILTYYDEDGGRFIIEWSRVNRLWSRFNVGEEETFEIILYEIRLHPTYSNDGIIDFQYLDCRNGSTPAHRDTPYCTIGIGNLDDSDGLEYTYWRQFHPGAMIFENDRAQEIALRFTTATELITGVLAGRVIDHRTHQTIEGAQVTTSRGFWAITDDRGQYEIDDILIGDGYDVTVRAQGYNDSTRFGEDGEGYVILENEVTRANFALLHPEFNIDEDLFTYRLLPDTTAESSFNLINSGNGTLDFTSRYIYVFEDEEERNEAGNRRSLRKPLRETGRDDPDEAWDPLLTWIATDSVDDFRLHSVVYAENEWIVAGANNSNRTPNYFYKFNRWGGYIETIDQPIDGYGVKGMDYYDGYLYCVASPQSYIFKIDPSDGELLDSLATPHRVSSVQSIAIDPATGYIYTAAVSNDIHRLELVGDTVLVLESSYNIIDPRDGEIIRRYGLAWFRDDPDGFNLYIISDKELDYNEELPDISIFKMDINTGEVRFLTDLSYLDPSYEGRGGLYITPKWNNLVWVIATVLSSANGDMVGIFELAPNSSWVDYTPRSGTLIAGQDSTIHISINTDDLEYGNYGVVIEFIHNADDGITHVPISLEVGPFGVEEHSELPLEWALDQNYPNPFNPSTIISYSLKTNGLTRLTVYDIMGREVTRLVDEYQHAGRYRISLSCGGLAAGVYFYKIETRGFQAVRKMVLIK